MVRRVYGVFVLCDPENCKPVLTVEEVTSDNLDQHDWVAIQYDDPDFRMLDLDRLPDDEDYYYPGFQMGPYPLQGPE